MNEKTENKFIHENLSKIKTSIKNTSDKENDIFSDSSLELFDTFKPRSKTKINSKQMFNNINVDHIDFPKESDIKSKKYINSDLSIYNISSSSNDSFKSFNSLHSNPIENNYSKDNLSVTKDSIATFESKERNDIHDDLFEFKNNYTTPVKNHIQSNHLSESAKLLDRIYGKEWRCVDGVLKNSKTKYLNNELYDDYNK